MDGIRAYKEADHLRPVPVGEQLRQKRQYLLNELDAVDAAIKVLDDNPGFVDAINALAKVGIR